MKAVYAGVVFLGFLIFIARYLSFTRGLHQWKGGEEILISGKAMDNYQEDAFGVKFEMQGIEIQMPINKRINYGEMVKLHGVIKVQKTKDGREWISLEKIDVIKKSKAATIDRFIYGMRRKLEAIYVESLPQDEAALAAGLVVGGTRLFTTQMKQIYRAAGISHVVAASGYNVQLVVGWAYLLTRKRCGRFTTAIVVVGIIVFYCLLVGMTAPVVRAGLMAGLVVLGEIFGRKVYVWWGLILSAWLMLVITPALVDDASFLLSFMATVGIVWSSKIKINNSLILGLITTIVVQLFTTPVVMHYFGTFSLVAPTVNVIINPLVPFVTELSAISGLLGLIVPVVAKALLFVDFVGLKMLNLVATGFGNLPFATIIMPKISYTLMSVIYGGLFGVYQLWQRRTLASR